MANRITVLETTPNHINDSAYEMPDRFAVDLVQLPDGAWKASALGFDATDKDRGWAMSSVNQQVREALKAKKLHF